MKRHNSQRGWFAYELYKQMKKSKNVWLLVGDLGYKMFDSCFKDFPDRCKNVGAAEQAMIGIACGLALEGKKVFVYSITNFLLYRPYEWIRNYVNFEKIPIVLVASGRGDDYKDLGFTHCVNDDDFLLFENTFPNVWTYFPETKEEIPSMVKEIVDSNKPSYLNLTR